MSESPSPSVPLSSQSITSSHKDHPIDSTTPLVKKSTRNISKKSPPARRSIAKTSTPDAPPNRAKTLPQRNVPAGHGSCGREYLPKFRMTTFSCPLSNGDSSRSASSWFLTQPSQEVLKILLNDNVEPIIENEESVSDVLTIVLHLGSRSVLIGKNTDLKPIPVPAVIARRYRCDAKLPIPLRNTKQETSPEVLVEQARMDGDFASFLRASSIRVPLNAYSTTFNNNSMHRRSEVVAVNDPFHMEWRRVDPDDLSSPEYFCGQDALNLDICPNPCIQTEKKSSMQYRLNWPFDMRTWNTSSYSSIMSWRNDVFLLLQHALSKFIEFEKHQFSSPFRIALAVPDLYDQLFVNELVSIILEDIGAMAILLQQESPMACCGAGLSTACVVDIGATMTSVAVIDGGEISCAAIGLYGGDDVTLELYRRLRANRLPIELNPEVTWDWRLLQDIKEQWCLAIETELAVNTYDLFHRSPRSNTYHYQVKVYNEVYMAPLSLFYPRVYPIEHKLGSIGERNLGGYVRRKLLRPNLENVSILFNVPISPILDMLHWWQTRGSLSNESKSHVIDCIEEEKSPTINPVSFDSKQESHVQSPSAKRPCNRKTEEKHEETEIISNNLKPPFLEDCDMLQCATIPLDLLVAHVLCKAAAGSEERLRRFCGTLLLVGGAGKVRGFATHMLEPRVQSVLPMVAETHGINPTNAAATSIKVIHPPRDMDHRHVVWKGVSVATRLDCCIEAWTTPGEWRAWGPDFCITNKSYLTKPNWSTSCVQEEEE